MSAQTRAAVSIGGVLAFFGLFTIPIAGIWGIVVGFVLGSVGSSIAIELFINFLREDGYYIAEPDRRSPHVDISKLPFKAPKKQPEEKKEGE